MTLTLTDDELNLVVTSLSITRDSLVRQMERHKSGQRYRDAQSKYAVCKNALGKAESEQTARVTGHHTERTEP
jgi:hypothetical protein